MELADPVGVPMEAAGVGAALAGALAWNSAGVLEGTLAELMGAGGVPVTLGGRCSIIRSASARLPPIPSGVVMAENMPLEF
jgi:hypothetical protein